MKKFNVKIFLFLIFFLSISLTIFPKKTLASSPLFVQKVETVWNTSVSPKATSIFNVQAGDVLVAYSAVGWTDGNETVSVSGGSLTWTTQQAVLTFGYSPVSIFTAIADTDKAMSVTFSCANCVGDNQSWGGNVLAFRNSSGIGTSAKANVSSGAPTLSITTTQNNSAIVVVNSDTNTNDGASRVWRNNAGTFTEQSYYFGTYTTYGGYYGDVGSTGTYAVGLSAPSAQKYSIIALEIKGSGASAPSDTTAPSVPTNFFATAVSSSAISLSWTASTDDTVVTGYKIYRNGVLLTTVNSPLTTFLDTGLSPSTQYSYTVSAYDAAGNNSSQSSSASATTQTPAPTPTPTPTPSVTPTPTPTPTIAGSYPWSGIIAPDRAIDWSQAGIPGGIPSRATICSTLNSPGISTDATSLIQSALNNCPSGQTVLLNPGTFRINSSISIPSNKTLRGSGADQTKLDLRGNSNAAINFGSAAPSVGISNTITAGATKDSTTITVSGSGITTGQMLLINGTNLSYMTENGAGGTCGWCNNGFPGDQGQVVEVIGVSGSNITFRPALYIDYMGRSPKAYRFNPGVKYAGLEDLELYSNNTGYTNVIYMGGALYSWVKGIENDFADNAHAQIEWSLGNEFRDNYFHDGYNHGPGGTDNQLNLARFSSGNLIENNIFWRQHASIMAEWGASGNVIAYNLMTGNYHESQLTWMINDTNWHGAHPSFNLLEGNVGDKVELDDYWGSSSHTTFFRDYYTGSRQYVPPMNARGALQSGSSQWEDSNSFAYVIDSLSTYTNMVGTIAGSSHLLARNPIAWQVYPASGATACVRVGYNSNDGNPMASNAYSTMFMHGAYDCRNNTFQWASGVIQTLPASFYLTSKPAYFGNTPWPPIGPDINTGVSGFAKYVNTIPVQTCFNSVTNNGTSNTGAFNASTCYASTGGGDTTAPSVPTGLSATAISSSAINLSWTASTDPVVSGQATSGVTGYRIYRGGVLVGTTITNNYNDNGLNPSTLYSYTVSAYDAAGNTSPQSTSASATTQSGIPIAGDLNLDHIVNALDYSLLNSKWLQSFSAYDLQADGLINSLDFAILSSNWGKTW